ncbi:MAG: DUF2061 domain-containing protein [Pseudomonadota bacterium]
MRSLFKTSTYAAMHFVVAFTVAFALTRSVAAAAAIGVVEPLIQTVAYALHERVWERGGRGSGKTVGMWRAFRANLTDKLTEAG